MMAAFFVPAPSTASTPTPCQQTYRTATYRTTASRIYHQAAPVGPRQDGRLLGMRRCAISPAAHAAMIGITHRQTHARHHRALLAARSCGTPACNRRLAHHLVLLRFGPGAFQCLDAFIGSHESGWSDDVSYGGAHGPPGQLAWGIPQALPPQKMASAGADWATSPRTQIRWLMHYVTVQYGGPCRARAFWFAHHWY